MAVRRFKTTVYVDRDVYGRLQVTAEREGRPVAALVREALETYAAKRAAPQRPLSIGIVDSGRSDGSRRLKEVVSEAIAEKFRRRGH
jgi:predicted transcriptional regulator